MIKDEGTGLNLWVEPEVTLIGKWQFLGHPKYDVPHDGDNITRGLAFAAKGCYKSFGPDGRANEANQRAILEHGHGSVLEHASLTFYIEGISRNLTLEMNRHRHLGISQESTRYVDESNSAFVLEPFYAELFLRYERGDPLNGDELALLHTHLEHLKDSLNQYGREYDLLVKLDNGEREGFDLRKWARGKARNVLPGSLETKVTYTGNLRAWRHFIESRSSMHAEPEIRRLAMEIYYAIKGICPLYVEDYMPNIPGTTIKRIGHRKV